MTLARELYRVTRRNEREAPLDERDLDETPVLGDDPEVAHLKRHYRREFADSFAAAVAALDPADRRILRFHFVNRHSIDEIGVLLRIHRATAARRLATARGNLAAGTRAAFLERCRVDDGQMQSILWLIESQLDMSVRALLRDEG